MATPAISMVLLQGQRIILFVSPWSTTTMIESKDPLGGRSVIRSMETYWKRWVHLDNKGEKVGMMEWG